VAARASASWLNQPPGKAAGDQVARDLVSAAPLPPGSQRLAKSPLSILDKPSTTLGDDNFLDHNAWWKADHSTKDLLTYLRAHPLKGLVLRVTGSGVSGFNQPFQWELEFDGAQPLAGNPALQYTITAAGPHASWVRVDGWSIWYPPRPPDETAPTTGTVVISITSGPTRKVTDLAVVHRLATEFNGLLRATPRRGGGRNCTAADRTLSISFTKPAETSPTITASQSGCAPLWLARGPSGDLPALEDSGNLLADALRVLGLPSDALAGLPPIASPSSAGSGG
jgi:hypothetical protein